MSANPFPDSIYEEQMLLAERELSSFIAAVTMLYGLEQPGFQRRIGLTNRTLWTARLDLKPEIGDLSRPRRRLAWRTE
jgi:hypothetical protein